MHVGSHIITLFHNIIETKCDYSFLDLCFPLQLGCNDNSVFFVEGLSGPILGAPQLLLFARTGDSGCTCPLRLAGCHGNKSSMLMEEAEADAWSAKAGSGVIRAGAASTTCVITARRSQCECSTSEANVGNIQFIIRDSAVSSAGWLG